MSYRIGTSNFKDQQAAVRYYGDADEVQTKLDEGAIFIGPPSGLNKNERLHINDEGRYEIEYLNGYKCFYYGKTVELYAATSLEASVKAVEHFKPHKRLAHMISVVLCESANGTTIVHKPGEL